MQKQYMVILRHASKSKETVYDFNFVVETIRAKSDQSNFLEIWNNPARNYFDFLFKLTSSNSS